MSAALFAACAGTAQTPPAAPPAAATASAGVNAPQTVQIKLEEGDFRESGKPHQAREVKVPVGATVVLTMGSNPTTGHRWNENAEIDNAGVLKQVRRGWVGPDTPVPGAGGHEQWVLQALAPGQAVAKWSYGPAWVAGAKVWTMMLTVKVQ
jgi:predicted secreted protein